MARRNIWVTNERMSEEVKKCRFHRFSVSGERCVKAVGGDIFLSGQATSRLLGHDRLDICLKTEKPVAVDSLDHIHPWGAKQDNGKNLGFNNRLCRWVPIESLGVLDIGCSGGGVVKSLYNMGILAVGVEGSDYSKSRARAEWGTIPIAYLLWMQRLRPIFIRRGWA